MSHLLIGPRSQEVSVRDDSISADITYTFRAIGYRVFRFGTFIFDTGGKGYSVSYREPDFGFWVVKHYFF